MRPGVLRLVFLLLAVNELAFSPSANITLHLLSAKLLFLHKT